MNNIKYYILKSSDVLEFYNLNRCISRLYDVDKHHINYLGNYYNTWFTKFYKNDEIIILKRRDTWKWFLSFLFQDFTDWKFSSFTNEDDIENVDINNLLNNYNYRDTLTQFFSIKSQLDNCVGTVLYYEDLNYNNTRNKKLSNQ
jgi:hypothetical protein